MKIRYFLLLTALAGIVFLTGCSTLTKGGEAYFSYREKPFRAEVRGTIDGTVYSAEIGRTDTATHDDPLANTYIRYLSPQALTGLTLYVGENGQITASLGELSAPTNTDTVAGWLLPLTLLSECTELISVQKEEETLALHLPQGTLYLSKDGAPTKLQSTNVKIDVVWWEWVE